MNVFKKVGSIIYNRTLHKYRIKKQLKQIPALINYLAKVRNSSEIYQISEYLQSKPNSLIPYDFTEKYLHLPIELTLDHCSGYIRAKVDERWIYFPSIFNEDFILESVRIGLMEQNDRSPHRYLHNPGEIITGKYAVLAGASNCLFALSIVEGFEKIFLFEPDSRWHGPMKLTMKAYRDKIEIVPKQLGELCSTRCVSLDSYFHKCYSKVDFVQADIEGDEVKMLFGAQELLQKSGKLKLSVACYHRSHHEMEICDFLRARGFSVKLSDGYMLLWMHYPLEFPYLRRGVVYGQKKGCIGSVSSHL